MLGATLVEESVMTDLSWVGLALLGLLALLALTRGIEKLQGSK